MVDEDVECSKWYDAYEEERAKAENLTATLETIRLTLPARFRPDVYEEVSASINKWAEDKQSFINATVESNDELRAKLRRAEELRESAQSVTRRLQSEHGGMNHLDRDGCLARVIGEMRGEIEVLREKLLRAEEAGNATR
jgi:hypothetical protein